MKTITTEARAPIKRKDAFGFSLINTAVANGMRIPTASAPKKFLMNQAPKMQATQRIGSKNEEIKIAKNSFMSCFS